MKISVVVKRNKDNIITTIVAPFTNLGVGVKLFPQSHSDRRLIFERDYLQNNNHDYDQIGEYREYRDELRDNITKWLTNYLETKPVIATTIVPFNPSSMKFKNDQTGGSYQWIEVDINPRINNRFLKIAGKLLPTLSVMAFLSTFPLGVILDKIYTQETTGVSSSEAIASVSTDVLNNIIAYYISQTYSNMSSINKRLLGMCYHHQNYPHDYNLEEDFILITRREKAMKFLRSPTNMLVFLVSIGWLLAWGYNTYLGTLSDYNVTMENMEDAQAQNNTPYSASQIEYLTNIDYFLSLAVELLNTISQYSLAGIAIVNLLEPEYIDQKSKGCWKGIKSGLSSLARSIGFYRQQNEPLLPIYQSAGDESVINSRTPLLRQ